MKVSSYFKFGGKVQKATTAAFLFYRETESDEVLEYTSQNISFDVVRAFGAGVGESLTASNGDTYTVFTDATFFTVATDYVDGERVYSGPTFEYKYYDAFCLPRADNAGMFASIADAENGVYQDNVYQYVGNGESKDESGGRLRPGDENRLAIETTSCWWVILDGGGSSALADTDYTSLNTINADVFIANMGWQPENVQSVEYEVSGDNLILRNGDPSDERRGGHIFDDSVITLGDPGCPLFFGVSGTPPEGSCSFFISGGLEGWDADFWEQTSNIFRDELDEERWGYILDENGEPTDTPGSQHGQPFGISTRYWRATGLDSASFAYCGMVGGKNIEYGGSYDPTVETTYTLQRWTELYSGVPMPTWTDSEYSIWGAFGAQVQAQDIPAVGAYLNAILSHWGVTGKTVVFVGARNRWGCGTLGSGEGGTGLPDAPPELLETFEAPEFSGRFAEIFVQMQFSGKAFEVKLPIRFFHRVTKASVSTLSNSGGEHDYCDPSLGEPFYGAIDMVSATTAVARIYYEPTRTWFDGYRMKEGFDQTDNWITGPIQRFGYSGGYFDITISQKAEADYHRCNPKLDYFNKCAVFVVGLVGDALQVMFSQTLTYPTVPDYPNLVNNSIYTYQVYNSEVFNCPEYADDIVREDDESLDYSNIYDYLITPASNHKLALGVPYLFQLSFALTSMLENYTDSSEPRYTPEAFRAAFMSAENYPAYITNFSGYDTCDKIIFSLLGKPYALYNLDFTSPYPETPKLDYYYVRGAANTPIGLRPFKNPNVKMPGFYEVPYRAEFLIESNRGIKTGWGGEGYGVKSSRFWHGLFNTATSSGTGSPDGNYWFYVFQDEYLRCAIIESGGRIFLARIRESDLRSLPLAGGIYYGG